MAVPGPSTSSLASHTGSFVSSINSDSPAYRFEFERLQIRYRESQENLRIARETAAAQQELFDRERASIEAQHQQELEEARRGSQQSKSDGKRRKK
jgi:hypothetical protein